jgi:hypothetical protein
MTLCCGAPSYSPVTKAKHVRARKQTPTPHESSPLPRHSHDTNMANPYLVQALYGPKPVAPGAENVKPTAANNAPAPSLYSRRESAADVKPNIAQGASTPAPRPSNPFGGRVGGVQFGNFSDAIAAASRTPNLFSRTPADGIKTVTFGSALPLRPTPSLEPKSILKPTAPASSPAVGPPPFVKVESGVKSAALSKTTTLRLGKNSSGVKPASLSSAPAPQPLSLLERLYGPQPTVKEEKHDYIHPARRQMDAPEGESSDRRIHVLSMLTGSDKSEDSEEEAEPWSPTGANVLPLGTASAESSFPSLSSAPAEALIYPKPAATPQTVHHLPNIVPSAPMQALTLFQPSTLRGQLKLPSEFYLPPPGPFYDQFMLASIFDINFSLCACWVCWLPPAKCNRRLQCWKRCRVCDDKHTGQVSCRTRRSMRTIC